MAKALQELGFEVQPDEAARTITVTGRPEGIPNAEATLHVGNAGTAARFLTAFLCLREGGTYHLDGDAAMRERPMRGLLDALQALGAKIVFHGRSGCFPFTLRTHGLRGPEVTVDASASSQILSALLMVAPLWSHNAPYSVLHLKGETVSEPFLEITLRMMGQFGLALWDKQGASYLVGRVPHYALPEPASYAIEPDATAASYFLALPLATGGSALSRGMRTDLLQGDTAFVRVLEKVGVAFEATADGLKACAERCGGRGVDENFNAFSDTFLTLAAVAPLLSGPTVIRGIGHTRRQETDRVLAMAQELERLGQRVEPTVAALRAAPELDSLTVHPDLEGLRARALAARREGRLLSVHTYEDHRVAMSFGVLGSFDLLGDGAPWLEIEDPACCGKTFPNFFEVLGTLRESTATHAMSPTRPTIARPQTPFLIVAVDGGAASGKSSTSRALAERFNLMHVDTGSHYRAVTRCLLDAKVPVDAPDAVAAYLQRVQLGTEVEGRRAQISVGGAVPVDATLRTPDVNAAVAPVAAQPAVREFLYAYQRRQGEVARARGFRGLIMEGRDIGSVIFPDADLRVFLEADPEIRARRRVLEGQQDSIRQRDTIDAGRKTAPLKCPEGAYRLDSSEMTLEEVVDHLAAKIAVCVR